MRTIVCRKLAVMRSYDRRVFLQQREQHRVLPLAVPEVRPPLHALAHEPDSFGMADRPLVEAVARKLEPVVAELDEQVAAAAGARLRRRCRPRNVGMDRRAPRAARCDAPRSAPRTPSPRPARRRPRRSGARSAPARAADRSTSAAIPSRSKLRPAAQERLGLLAVQELDEPVDVSHRRPPDRDRHAASSSINASSGS